MNRTKIEWTDFTWNPVTGCKHGCDYCYGQRIAQRFPNHFPDGYEPTFHEDRLQEPLERKKPSMIFTVNMGDLFGKWAPDEWIVKVLQTAWRAQQHTFQFLTKNPYRYAEYDFAQNHWLGMTMESCEQNDRFNYFYHSIYNKRNITFISFEPLLGPIDCLTAPMFNLVDWVIIGALTGPNGRQPEKEWVQDIIDKAREADCAIFLKDNLDWPETVQEWPGKEGQDEKNIRRYR